MKIGFTSGCFDLIHYGHLYYLNRCKEHCDYLIVGVDSDSLVKEFKGDTRPIICEEERIKLVESLSGVDKAVVIPNLKLIGSIVTSNNVNVVFKHEGYKCIDYIYGVTDTGIELKIIPNVKGLISTSEIIKKIVNVNRKVFLTR